MIHEVKFYMPQLRAPAFSENEDLKGVAATPQGDTDVVKRLESEIAWLKGVRPDLLKENQELATQLEKLLFDYKAQSPKTWEEKRSEAQQRVDQELAAIHASRQGIEAAQTEMTQAVVAKGEVEKRFESEAMRIGNEYRLKYLNEGYKCKINGHSVKTTLDIGQAILKGEKVEFHRKHLVRTDQETKREGKSPIAAELQSAQERVSSCERRLFELESSLSNHEQALKSAREDLHGIEIGAVDTKNFSDIEAQVQQAFERLDQIKEMVGILEQETSSLQESLSNWSLVEKN